jgi:hypothetical protein
MKLVKMKMLKQIELSYIAYGSRSSSCTLENASHDFTWNLQKTENT